MTSIYSFLKPAFIVAGMCIALCGLAFAASPQLPCEFYGTVSVQGSPAPAGTVVSAYVNDINQGNITVTEPGKFGGLGTFDERLIVMAGENDFANGAPTITFKINGQSADQSATYQPGASSALNLTTGGGQPSVLVPSSPSGNSSQTPVIVAQVPTTPSSSSPSLLNQPVNGSVNTAVSYSQNNSSSL